MPKSPRRSRPAAKTKTAKKVARKAATKARPQAAKRAGLRAGRDVKVTAPTWDLSHLYAGPSDPELARDLARCEEESKAFEADYKGKLGGLDGAALGGAVAAYEAIDERLSKAMTYASLLHSAKVTDPVVGRFFQTTREKANDIA